MKKLALFFLLATGTTALCAQPDSLDYRSDYYSAKRAPTGARRRAAAAHRDAGQQPHRAGSMSRSAARQPRGEPRHRRRLRGGHDRASRCDRRGKAPGPLPDGGRQRPDLFENYPRSATRAIRAAAGRDPRGLAPNHGSSSRACCRWTRCRTRSISQARMPGIEAFNALLRDMARRRGLDYIDIRSRMVRDGKMPRNTPSTASTSTPRATPYGSTSCGLISLK